MKESEIPATTAKPWLLYSGKQRWVFLSVLFLVSTSNYVDRNIISVLLEPIKEEFQISDTMLGLLTGISFALFYATLGIPVARLADRGNRKMIITASLTVWSVMTMLCGAAHNFFQLVLARIGVGAGEAGAIPPAQSLIADYFPPEQRARAIAVFMASAMAGYLIGVVIGAQIAAAHGWRWAFILVGAPGLLLALLTHFVLKEPRLMAALRMPVSTLETVSETFAALRAKKSYMNLLYGLTVYFFIAYGALVFVPSYLMRIAGIDLATVGVAYGSVAAIASVAGNIIGGVLCDRLSIVDSRWLAWFPALGLVLTFPFYAAAFLFTDLTIFLILSGIATLFLNAAIPGIFSALHAVCGSQRRAMAVAITFFFGNLFGLGLGPVVAGGLSDLFTAHIGVTGLRYALILVMALLLPTAWFFYRTGKHLTNDMEA